MITQAEYSRAKSVISAYNKQLEVLKLGNRIVYLEKQIVSPELYASLTYYFATRKGVSPRKISLNLISMFTISEFQLFFQASEDFKPSRMTFKNYRDLKPITKAQYNEINSLLVDNGFDKLNFKYPY